MPSSYCRICHRPLSDPESVRLGIGPVCRGYKNIEQGEFDFMGKKEKVNAIEGFGDIICKPDGTTNVPHRIVYHSPTGLAWGYGGSGPADFALNALAVYIGSEEAEKYYQAFKWQFVAAMPAEGGIIKHMDVMHWLDEQRRKNNG